MNKFLFLIILTNLLMFTINESIDCSKLEISSKTDQLIFVIPNNYKTSTADFYYFIKQNDVWKEVITTKAYIGKNGLGKEKEGDYKTPIGAYKFNKYFGINDNPGTKMPYIKLNNSLYWDGDSNSKRYNQMVNIETYKDFDKSKSEHLIDAILAYKYAMNINYNENGTPFKGSAIFLHCYSYNQFTAGCVAIPEKDMIKVLKNVHKDTTIIIDLLTNLHKY